MTKTDRQAFLDEVKGQDDGLAADSSHSSTEWEQH